MGLYGDDCRYTKSGEKLVVLNVNILLQKFKSNFAHDQQFFMYYLFFTNLGDNTKLPGCRVSRLVADYSLKRIFQVLLWSLDAPCSSQ